MKTNIINYWKLFYSGTKNMFCEFFNKKTNKMQRANMWTFIRLITPIITIILSIIGILTNKTIILVIAGIIAGFGAFTDFMDGRSSRKYGSSSEYGKLLDQVSDKVFAGLICLNILFINFNYILIFIGEFIIAAINIYYKNKYKNIKINSLLIGKFKQFPLFITLCFGYISNINNNTFNISNIMIIVTFIIQIITSISYIYNNRTNLNII